PGGAIEQVFTTPSKRTTLVNNIVDAIKNDPGGYNAGVNFDVEFSWGSSVRDGIVLLLQELRTAFDAQGLADKEISIYTHPTLSTSQWNIAGMEPYIDYLIYSGYDFSTGTTPNAVGDWASMTSSDTRIPGYFEQGLPPEKLVIAFPTYGRTWDDTTQYGVSGGSSGSTGRGFTDGLYDTTINTANGGPQTHNYQTGDETAWYTYNDGTDHVVVWEGIEGINYKIRQALTIQDPTSGVNMDGRKVGGVAFWSMNWLAETTSRDPRTNTTVTRTRTYPHFYQVLQEALSAKGQTRFLIDGFEGRDPRWRDPDLALDTAGDTDNNSSWDNLARPSGSGAPSNSTLAATVNFDFEAAGPNKGVFAHEVLNSTLVPGTRDRHAVAALFDSTTLLQASIHTATAYSGRTVRMLVIDANGQLEAGPTISLNATGWRTLSFDLTAGATGFTTVEPNFTTGDGVIQTAGGGAKDIAFYGFAVEGGGAGVVTVVFDEITYEHVNPGGKNYKINEVRYDGNTGEFVEIYGPAGSLPAGMEIRTIVGTDGSVSALPISGSIPDDGGGFGYFVVGDSNVPSVDYSTGFSTSTSQLSDANPSGLQLWDATTGGVYDSVVYEAFGGIDDLARVETLGVVDEGWPWLGRISNGTDGSSAGYTAGRYPDGNDTDVNSADFSSMVATPGAANGGKVPGGAATYSFDTVPAAAFQSFQTFTVASPAVGASAGGGNAHRCVDTTGGGVMSFIGDAALGAGGTGYKVTGEVFIPAAAAPAQAIGVGFCGSQGSHFFTASQAAAGYENGYWIIFENQAGIGLNDGQADHPGVFHFLHATNDNMDGNPTELLGSATLAAAGVTEGAWTTFELVVDPSAAVGSRLVVVSRDFPERFPRLSGNFSFRCWHGIFKARSSASC
ncbi:hypothetical protein GC173_11330, partial [bacterium]|nr:hypothetical protein [bacterium]